MGTVLSTALVPISLVLANQFWPGKLADTRVRRKGRKSRRKSERRRRLR